VDKVVSDSEACTALLISCSLFSPMSHWVNRLRSSDVGTNHSVTLDDGRSPHAWAISRVPSWYSERLREDTAGSDDRPG
jgi:hypothetical protein